MSREELWQVILDLRAAHATQQAALRELHDEMDRFLGGGELPAERNQPLNVRLRGWQRQVARLLGAEPGEK